MKKHKKDEIIDFTSDEFTIDVNERMEIEINDPLSRIDVLSYVLKNRDYTLLIRGNYDVYIKALVHYLADHRPEQDRNIEALSKIINASISENDCKAPMDIIYERIANITPDDIGVSYYEIHKKRTNGEQNSVIKYWQRVVSEYLSLTQKESY